MDVKSAMVPDNVDAAWRFLLFNWIVVGTMAATLVLSVAVTNFSIELTGEIIQELVGLRDRIGFATLFITHDLSLLVELADEIAVMYAGRLMERAPAASLFNAPRLPYTHGLIHCFPPMHGAPRKPISG